MQLFKSIRRWWLAGHLAALHKTRLGLIKEARVARRMHKPVKALEFDLIGVTREILAIEAKL